MEGPRGIRAGGQAPTAPPVTSSVHDWDVRTELNQPDSVEYRLLFISVDPSGSRFWILITIWSGSDLNDVDRQKILRKMLP